MKKIFKIFAFALGLLVSLMAVVSVWILIFKPGWVETALKWLSERFSDLGMWNYAIVLGSVFLDGIPVVGTLVPGDKVFIAEAGLWAGGNFVGLIFCAFLGALLGNAFSYVLGRIWGPWLVKEFGIWFGLGETEVSRVKDGLDRQGFWFVLASKFHNAFRWAVPFVVGAAGMPPRRFWGANLMASSAWVIVLGIVGKFAFAYSQQIIRSAGWIVTGLMLVGILWLVIFRRAALARYWKDKQSEIDGHLGEKKPENFPGA